MRAQLLDGSARTMLDTIRRIGFLQIDPIATVATPQHLVLWSRLGAFDTAKLDRLIWRDRKLFEWNAYIWPIETLPAAPGAHAQPEAPPPKPRVAEGERGLPPVRLTRAHGAWAVAVPRDRRPQGLPPRDEQLVRRSPDRAPARSHAPGRDGRGRRPPQRPAGLGSRRALVSGDRPHLRCAMRTGSTTSSASARSAFDS